MPNIGGLLFLWVTLPAYGACAYTPVSFSILWKTHLYLMDMCTFIGVTFNQSVGGRDCHQHESLLLAYGLSFRAAVLAPPVIAKRHSVLLSLYFWTFAVTWIATDHDGYDCSD